MSLRLGKALRLLGCVLSLMAAEGCGNACLDLAGQVCACLPDDGSRSACNQRAKDAQADFPLSKQDEAYCQRQIDTHACDCRKLATPEGRVGCGLSFAYPDPALP